VGKAAAEPIKYHKHKRFIARIIKNGKTSSVGFIYWRPLVLVQEKQVYQQF
jgi:hypothetical protein